MHNLKTVIIFEFLRTIKKKYFWVSLLIMPVFLVIVIMLSYSSGQSASEMEDEITKEQFSASIIDESGIVTDEVLAMTGTTRADNKVEEIEKVKSGQLDSFIYYPENPSSQDIEIYGQDVGLTKNSKYSYLATHLLKSSIIGKFESPEEVSLLQTEPKTDLTIYDNGSIAEGFERVIIPGFFLILFYFLIILLGNHMLTSTTEEKENRVIEIVLTSVDAGSLIIGKIIAMILVGILQVTILSLPLIITLIFFQSSLNLPFNISELAIDPLRIIFGAIIFGFSFLLFTGILVTIGAIMPTAKEAGGFFGFAMFFMFIPLYSLMAIISDPSQLIVKIFTFFPLTAPITLLLRNAVGNLNLVETIVGILILAVSSSLLLVLATRAFRYGTLEYDNKLSLKRLFNK